MASRSFRPSSPLTFKLQRPPLGRTSSSSSDITRETPSMTLSDHDIHQDIDSAILRPISSHPSTSQSSPSSLSSAVVRANNNELPGGLSSVTPPDAKGVLMWTNKQTHAATPPPQRSPSSSAVDFPKNSCSRPIAIQLPSGRSKSAVTPPAPLTGRGDVLGGYFPFHEEVQKSYVSHPFQQDTSASSMQSTVPSASSSSPRLLPALTLSAADTEMSKSQDSEASQGPSAMPESVVMPKGKYYPSNYKNPRSQTKSGGSPPRHMRQSSDIKKKLQQYQRDMVAQAKLATRMAPKVGKPTSPRLLPLGSPGPITPLELEESGGYLIAGSRAAPTSPGGQQELISRMIRTSQESPNQSGPSSPVISAGGR